MTPVPTAVLHRPEPCEPGGRAITKEDDPSEVAGALLSGTSVAVTDHYRTGLAVLEALETHRPTPPSAYAERRREERSWERIRQRLTAPIEAGALALEGGGTIGFLSELYPDLDRFHLPFVQVQQLHHAWERYLSGVQLAVLGRKLHPFYGTYAPTRTEHIELFATWLSRYQGPRDTAVDVGTGCGVLAFMLARAGFDAVDAVDINPNAVESVRRELGRVPMQVHARVADLLEGQGPTALIVFNPPWTAGEPLDPFEQAMVYPQGLFERFFDQAVEVLQPEGRISLVFSSLIRLVQPDLPHPIDAELERGRLRVIDRMQRRIRPPKGSGRRTRERVEVWELAHR